MADDTSLWDSITGFFTSDSSGSTPDYSSTNALEALFGDQYTGTSSFTDTAVRGEMPDGSIAYSNGIVMKPNGDVFVNGELFGNTSETGSGSLDTSWGGTIGNWLGSLGSAGLSAVKGLVTNSKGQTDFTKLAGLAGGIMGAINPSWGSTQQNPVGYTGGIPSYTAVREQVPGTYDPNRRPGSRGQEYFTNVQYAAPTDVATAKAAAAQQATEAEARNKARTAEMQSAPPRQDYAAGGLANLAQGRYLAGATDGMADKIPATIANQQPAKLSHGEFVIPADVVSHLGNGNSDAGAQRLYGMMDKVRQARTGTKKQGKQINPNKYLPG